MFLTKKISYIIFLDKVLIFWSKSHELFSKTYEFRGGGKQNLSKIAVAFSIIAASCFVAKPAQAVNLVQNGSFENITGSFINNGQGAMSLNPGSTTIPGWTVTNAELAWVDNTVTAFGASRPITPFGSFFLDLTGYHDFSPYGGVSQTINTTINQQYTLSLSLGIVNPTWAGPISVVATAGSVSQTFTFNPSGSGNQWGDFNFDFTATNTSTLISIVGTSTANIYYIGLDNVSVEAKSVKTVPEPLTILGAGTAIGFSATFKRKLAKTNKKK